VNLSDQVAFVTRVGTAAGRTAALCLAREGAAVFVTDASPDKAAAVAAEIVRRNGKAESIGHDITDEASWETAFSAAKATFGPLTILVNGPPDTLTRPIASLSLDEFRRAEAINITGPWLGLRQGILAMREAGKGGSIITLSTLAAKLPGKGSAVNTAAAGGVRIMGRAAALECGAQSDGIRINLIELTDTTPDEDLAGAVLYFAGPDSRFATGSEITLGAGVVL
jgi:3alpha(or 20beta)-hydroxysteroid dehydrogenase